MDARLRLARLVVGTLILLALTACGGAGKPSPSTHAVKSLQQVCSEIKVDRPKTAVGYPVTSEEDGAYEAYASQVDRMLGATSDRVSQRLAFFPRSLRELARPWPSGSPDPMNPIGSLDTGLGYARRMQSTSDEMWAALDAICH